MPHRAPLLVVAGPSGAGKSTLCRGVAEAARHSGAPFGGFITERRTVNRSFSGLDLVNAATGERCPLAEWDAPTGGPSTGRWFFHDAAFVTGRAWCRDVASDALLIVDEVGPLELGQGAGWAPLFPRLDARPGPLVIAVRPSLAHALGRVLPSRPAETVSVDEGRREAALAAVLTRLGLGA